MITSGCRLRQFCHEPVVFLGVASAPPIIDAEITPIFPAQFAQRSEEDFDARLASLISGSVRAKQDANTPSTLDRRPRTGHRGMSVQLPGGDICTAGKRRRLFDYLIGSRDQCRRRIEAKRLGDLEVDGEMKFGWLLNWQVGCLLTLENPIDVGRCASKGVYLVNRITDQTAF